jgi:hypothetical protein
LEAERRSYSSAEARLMMADATARTQVLPSWALSAAPD